MTRLRRWLRSAYRSVIPESIPPCDAETRQILELLLHPASNTIDIGCNRGSILQEIIRLAPEGQHWAFEPIPRLYQLLARRFPQVHCHQLALSDGTGTRQFHHFVDMDGFSGFHRREIDVDPGLVQSVQVQTARLDDIIPSSTHIHLMKIDVEGAELCVLLGATELMHRSRPHVVFECGLGGLDRYGHHPDQIYDYLARLDYKLYSFQRMLTQAKPLSREEFSTMFFTSKEYMYVATV